METAAVVDRRTAAEQQRSVISTHPLVLHRMYPFWHRPPDPTEQSRLRRVGGVN